MTREEAKALAAQFIMRCRGGFKDHFEHAGWLKKHSKEIAQFSPADQKAVLFEHEQATIPEFSTPMRGKAG